jgi:hypothetical protein
MNSTKRRSFGRLHKDREENKNRDGCTQVGTKGEDYHHAALHEEDKRLHSQSTFHS